MLRIGTLSLRDYSLPLPTENLSLSRTTYRKKWLWSLKQNVSGPCPAFDPAEGFGLLSTIITVATQ